MGLLSKLLNVKLGMVLGGRQGPQTIYSSREADSEAVSLDLLVRLGRMMKKSWVAEMSGTEVVRGRFGKIAWQEVVIVLHFSL